MARSLIAIGRSNLLYRSLEYLAESGFTICGIITDDANPEYEFGVEDFRHLADDLGARFIACRRLTSDVLNTVGDWVETSAARTAISANWRFLIPDSFLARFPDGVWNLHIGRLPDFKGNATANWSILTGETQTFANVHRMEHDLDAGAILARVAIDISPTTYVGDILSETERHAPGLFRRALERLDTLPHQVEIANGVEGLRCFPRLPEDGIIDWSESSDAVLRLVRATSRPYPGAFSYLQDRRVTVWRARSVDADGAFLAVPGQVLAIDNTAGTVRVACGHGAVDLEEVEVDFVVTPASHLVRGIRSRFRPAPAQPI